MLVFLEIQKVKFPFNNHNEPIKILKLEEEIFYKRSISINYLQRIFLSNQRS